MGSTDPRKDPGNLKNPQGGVGQMDQGREGFGQPRKTFMGLDQGASPSVRRRLGLGIPYEKFNWILDALGLF